MTARDSIKKIVQLVSTAGLPKETVNALETKLSSLEDQVMMMENENARLKDEVEKLKVQLKCLQPQAEEMSQDTIRVMRLIFDRAKDVSAEDISTVFKWRQGVADYHIDALLKKRFIRESSMGMRTPFGSSVPKFGLTTLGRRFIIQYTDI